VAVGSGAVVDRTVRPLSDTPYPRRVTVSGRLTDGRATVRQEYVLLAPAAPIAVEGLGLVIAGEDPSINQGEHA
jgi:hypothetical protein